LASPPYDAVREWMPAAGVTEIEAVPLAKVAFPMGTPLSRKVTCPVAAVGTAGTVAISVTDWPATIVFAESVSAVAVGALPTVRVTVPELPETVLSPPYDAVMVWLPTASVETEIVATPLAFNCALPRVVSPFRKVTVPVGTAEDDPPLTVAVSNTAWPKVEGFGTAVTLVVVAIFPTTWFTVFDVATPLLASPLYLAVNGCVPSVKVLVVKLALPSVSATVANVLVPSRNVTFPVTVPHDATVAVITTGWVREDGLGVLISVTVGTAAVTTWLTDADTGP
jgi:hypothetical protein